MGAFFDDGSFACMPNYNNDVACYEGLSFGGTRMHSAIGRIYAEIHFQLENVSAGLYHMGLVGTMVTPATEFYIVDYYSSSFSKSFADEFASYEVDGSTYFLYKKSGTNCLSGSACTQYYSIRNEQRICGFVDVNAHLDAWNSMGVELGPLQNLRAYTELKGNAHGTVDFVYAKVQVAN